MEFFRCPLSGTLLRNPVQLSTGQTFDKNSIEEWLQQIGNICPQQILLDNTLTPNHSVMEQIVGEIKEYWTRRLESIPEDDLKNDNNIQILPVDIPFASLEMIQMETAMQFRLLTEKHRSLRAIFGEGDRRLGFVTLISALLTGHGEVEQKLYGDMVRTIFNLSSVEDNKPILGDRSILFVLIAHLRTGTDETRKEAVSALLCISTYDSNCGKIMKLGAMQSLIVLIEEGNPLLLEDSANMIASLCRFPDNLRRAVQFGAVRVMMSKINDNKFVGTLLPLLRVFSFEPSAIREMREIGSAEQLKIMEVTGSEESVQECGLILQNPKKVDQPIMKELYEEDANVTDLSKLPETGTSEEAILGTLSKVEDQHTCKLHRSNPKKRMKVVAAFLLAALSGNLSPSVSDINGILGAVEAEADHDEIEPLLVAVRGRDITEIIASGHQILASRYFGHSSGAASGSQGGNDDSTLAATQHEEENIADK